MDEAEKRRNQRSAGFSLGNRFNRLRNRINSNNITNNNRLNSNQHEQNLGFNVLNFEIDSNENNNNELIAIRQGNYYIPLFVRRDNNNRNININRNRNRNINARIEREARENKKENINNGPLSFPEIIIEDINKLDEGNKSCMICLEEFHSKEKVTALPCLHYFHTQCIKKWIQKQTSCPVCKFELTQKNIEHKMKYIYH